MEDHLSAIRQYAEAYERLELLQRAENALLPVGDQKTGVIAEFYARIHAQIQFPTSELIFGTPSEHVWDIAVRTSGQPDHLIQVKCVSAHSRTSRVSQIHPGWHELYLLRLDNQFWPIGFWTLKATDAPWSAAKISGSTMPKRGIPASGSAIFSDATDQLEPMVKAIMARKVNNSFKPTRVVASATCLRYASTRPPPRCGSA